MHLKGALHVHSTCSDGELGLYDCLAAHQAMSFDFVALTDHDFLMKPGCYDEVADCVKALGGDMIVFCGVEMMLFEKGYVHVNRIPGEKELLYVFNHPAEYGLPVGKIIERIQALGRVYPLDAIEITSRGFYTPEYDIDEIPLVKVATDDSHQKNMIGRAWIEMDAPRNPDAILRAIKANNFWNCFK